MDKTVSNSELIEPLCHRRKVMTIQDEINNIETQLADLKAQQARCSHVWGEAKYNPYFGKEEQILPGRYETHGVHMYPLTTFVDVEKPRWTRRCNKCGLVQHTEKQADIPQPKKMTPYFGA